MDAVNFDEIFLKDGFGCNPYFSVLSFIPLLREFLWNILWSKAYQFNA